VIYIISKCDLEEYFVSLRTFNMLKDYKSFRSIIQMIINEVDKFVSSLPRVKIPLDETLIRSGNILNVLGLWRSLFVFKKEITKIQFIGLVKRNYRIKEELTPEMDKKVNEVWSNAYLFLKDLDVIVEYDDNHIKVKEPMDCFNI